MYKRQGPDFLDSFDAELFGELVETIIVESNERIRFRLKNGLEPVSYTHLDVYKRQIQTTLTRVMDPNEYDSLLNTLVASFSNINSEIIVFSPVSYTHLDVYKRQPLTYIYNREGIWFAQQKKIPIIK